MNTAALVAALAEALAAEDEVLDGNATYGSVCVAFAPPVLDRSSVTGNVPSAILKWLIVRLNMASAATAESVVSQELV